MCWGDLYASGGIGQHDFTYTTNSTPVLVPGINSAVAVSTGRGLHSCVVLADGTVMCWGANDFGQLGNGSLTNSVTPVLVSGITNAIAVSTGFTSTCAVLADGTLQCWGTNSSGIGSSTITSSANPVVVSGISNAVDVSLGARHACAALASGAVQCWGSNTYGQLGNGTATDSLTPVIVGSISNAVSVSAGDFFNYARLADGTLVSWGASPLGNNYYFGYYPEPIQVYGPTVWNSGNPGIASISPNGLVAAVASGTAPITVSNGGFNASTTVTVISGADIAVSMTDAPDPVRRGAKLTYTINVINKGPLTASNVTLTDTLPSNLAFVSALTSAGTCSGKSIVNCNLGKLANGNSATIKLVVKPMQLGTITNNVSVAASEDYNTSNNSMTVSTSVSR